MKLDYLKNNHPKDRKEIISVGLLGVSAFMGILIVIKVTAFFAAPARAENLVKRAVALSKPDANEVEKHLAKSKAIADVLKKKNLFAPPPPKQQPVKQVLGILGSEALINGKWYKVGDTIGDAKIVAIEPTRIKIDWDGREIVLAPIEAASSLGSGPPRRDVKQVAGGGGRPEMVVVRPEGRPMPGRSSALSPEERARRGGFEGMRERFQNMSSEERDRARAEMRARFENMSEEERERFRTQMRERFGGRGPGGERGRPGGERGPGGGRRPGGGGRR